MSKFCGISLTRRKWMYLVLIGGVIILHAILLLVFFPRGRKTAIPTFAIGLDTALVQMHCDTPGASIYFTKDGSIPSGRSVLELYTGAFRLRPGKWQLTAIAKRKDWERSEVARSADLDCRFEEDRSGVFCEPQGPDPSAPGLTANGNNPSMFSSITGSAGSPLIKEDGALSSSNFSTHGCTFPAGKTLREVRDVFQEKNLTLFKVEETWDREEPMDTVAAGSSTKDFCRGVDSREWDECFKYNGLKALSLSSTIDRVYIASIPCGFLGFAPRLRKERAEGRSGSFGGVPMDAERLFRHQPFVPMGSTAPPAVGEEMEYVERLAFGTMGKGGAAEAAHQVLPQLIYLAQHLAVDVKILVDLGHGMLPLILDLLRSSSGAGTILAESRLIQWEPKLYVAGTLYVYGEWPYRDRSEVKGVTLTTLGWKGTNLPRPLLAMARKWFEPLLPPAQQVQDGTVKPARILLIPDGLWGLALANRDQVERAILAFSVDPLEIIPAESSIARPLSAESLTHRMELFATANAVIAVHGPALSFLLWCKPGSRLLEIGLRQQQAGWRLYQEPLRPVVVQGPVHSAIHLRACYALSGGTAERPLWGKGYAMLARSSGMKYTPMPAAWTDSEKMLVVDPLSVVGWLSMLPHDDPRWPFNQNSFHHRFSTTSSPSTICNLPKSNVALRRPVRASSEILSQQAWGATDGDLSSRWSSQHTDMEWLEVDLGSSMHLCGVSVSWGSATAKSFEFQVAAQWGEVTDTSKREFEQSQKEAAAASSKVEEKTQIGERVGQVVIKEEDGPPTAPRSALSGDMKDAIAAMLKDLGTPDEKKPSPVSPSLSTGSTGPPSPIALGPSAANGSKVSASHSHRHLSDLTRSWSAPGRRLRESPADMEQEHGEDRCSSVEGGTAAQVDAKAHGWDVWKVSDCIDGFPEYCDVQCATPGKCVCKWSSGSSHRGGWEASEPSSANLGVVGMQGSGVNGQWRPSSEMFPGLERVQNLPPEDIPPQRQVQYGDFADSAQTKDWLKAYSSSDIDAQSSRLSQQNQFWVSRSYIFDAPMQGRWLRFVGKERTYRAYGFEIAEMCVFACPSRPEAKAEGAQ